MNLSEDRRQKFEQAAREHGGGNIVGELWQFLRENKLWWMIPIITVLLIAGAFVFLSGTAAAPFIYTLF